MSTLRHHKWYSAAVVLGLLAVVAEWAAKYQAGRTAFTIARRAADRSFDPGRAAVEYHQHWYTFWNLTGACSIALLACCWIMSWRRRESGSRALLVALVAIYLLSALIMV